MNHSTPIVWIIVLHWRGVELTQACLLSLKNLDYPSFRILLVDNGSPENDSKRLASQFKDISILRLDDNYGYTGGNNAGIDYCISRDAEFIWLLNNDATVYADTLDKLVAIAISDACAGAVGGSTTVQNTGSDDFEIIGQGIVDFTKATTPLITPGSGNTISCEWISGCNMLLRVLAIKQAGKLDDNYFLYFEDADLCMRFRKKGWKCILVPDARIEHIGGASTSKHRYAQYYYYARNRLYFFSTHAKGIQKYLCLGRIFSKLLRRLIVFPLQKNKKTQQLQAECHATRDFMLGKRGKTEIP